MGGVLAVIVGATVYLSEPGRSAWLPPCLFHKWTGLHCPGCGNTRALHALLHGHIGASLSYNPLLVPSVALLILLLFRPTLAQKHGFCLIVAVIILTFFFARNLPWWPFTLLAPAGSSVL